jgi:GTP diphosphokinase / guanosine-3',5'-bis(diphosphate) 3'-diphosphatase
MEQNKLIFAAHYAAEQHRLQRRKGPAEGDKQLRTPYINHPLHVAHLLANMGGVTDEDILCAGILHDTIEDTQATEEDLRALFGDRITDMVLEVSDDKSLPKERRKELQIEHASELTTGARLVKLADKITNVADLVKAPPTNWPLTRIREYFDWAQDVVTAVGPVNPALEATFQEWYAQKP